MNQFQVAATQAFVGAVDENQLAPYQSLSARVGERIEQHGCIAGSGVGICCGGAVKQLIAKHFAALVQDGLAADHGNGIVSDARRQAGC